MKNALIIFVRNPELGKVKTRLAADVGDEKALDIYKQLLQHTFNICSQVKADKYVFYNEEILKDDRWNAADFYKKLQANTDLGGKMKAAFQELFSIGYKDVIIIGSDCPELSTAIIEAAFKILEKKDVVIGPADDGGYYLLGMKKFFSLLFENKLWSTEHVFQQTISDLQKENISFSELITLTDIDTEDDWMKTTGR